MTRQFLVTTFLAAAASAPAGSAAPALHQVFRDDFLIGTALQAGTIKGLDETTGALIRRHYSCVTPGNEMKWQVLQRRPGPYRFAPADVVVEFAEANNMRVIGHTLVWHSQCPDWVFKDADGRELSRDELLSRMRRHIAAVVGRYRGRVLGWDVVNEAVEDNGKLRDSMWRKIIGDDYIREAFRAAHRADPEAELYYNDYGMTSPARRNTVVRTIRELRSVGVRIDAVGMQGHWRLDWPTRTAIEESILAFAETGAKVMITELDIDVLPLAWAHAGRRIEDLPQPRDKLDPYTDGLPDAVQEKLARRYEGLFALFLKHRDKITRVTFWGPTDAHSWVNNWPVRGRTNHPFLFDRQGRPKPAFYAVAGLKPDAVSP